MSCESGEGGQKDNLVEDSQEIVIEEPAGENDDDRVYRIQDQIMKQKNLKKAIENGQILEAVQMQTESAKLLPERKTISVHDTYARKCFYEGVKPRRRKNPNLSAYGPTHMSIGDTARERQLKQQKQALTKPIWESTLPANNKNSIRQPIDIKDPLILKYHMA